MFQLSPQQKERIEKAIKVKITGEATRQLAIGFCGFSAVGAAIGFFSGSLVTGAALGFAAHAIFMILTNDAIESSINSQSADYCDKFFQSARSAPSIVQKHYLENLEQFTDREMSKWAQRDFSVRIQAVDIIDLLK